jgi:hypothetical protein
MIATALVLSGVLFQVQDLRQKSAPCPYVLVTSAGERLGTLDLPKRGGRNIKLRLCPNGVLVMYAASEVDWEATEKANASPTPVPSPALAPTPTPQVLSGIANKMQIRDADGLVKMNEGSGKLKTASGREIAFEGRRFFGKDSVAEYLELGTFLADTSTCPVSRAVTYGVVKNISRTKLRDLKAYVVIGSMRTGQQNGQIQTMDPSNLMPGEEAKIFLYLSCDFATGGGYRSDNSIVVFIPDISGRTEALEKPSGMLPFDAGPAPSVRSSPTAPAVRTATPR